jgi:hypothetical protein
MFRPDTYLASYCIEDVLIREGIPSGCGAVFMVKLANNARNLVDLH